MHTFTLFLLCTCRRYVECGHWRQTCRLSISEERLVMCLRLLVVRFLFSFRSFSRQACFGRAIITIIVMVSRCRSLIHRRVHYVLFPTLCVYVCVCVCVHFFDYVWTVLTILLIFVPLSVSYACVWWIQFLWFYVPHTHTHTKTLRNEYLSSTI